MTNIVQIENNEVMTTSRNFAEVFGKRHVDVFRDIRDAMIKIKETSYILQIDTLKDSKCG